MRGMTGRTLKIGVDASGWKTGRGIGRHLDGLFNSLLSLGEPLEFTFFCPRGVQVPLRQGLWRRVEVGRGLVPRSYTDGLLPRAVAGEGVDLMHFPANTFWGKPHVPTVVTIHDLALLEFPDRFFRTRWAAAKYRARFTRLGGIASRVIAVSGHTAGKIVERSPHPCEMTTIHNGIDDRFRDASNVRAPVDGRVLYAGALDFRKNLTRLLEAFDIVRRTRPRAHLVLAGRRGTDRRVYPLIEIEARRLALGPSVEIVANPDDARLVDLYRSAAAFVFPSLYEGFGLPVLEAMAAGCPVACSRAASLPEVAGDAALLFDAEDPEAMAEAIESILDDPPLAASLSAAGRERAEGFTWERCARATLGVYRAALGIHA